MKKFALLVALLPLCGCHILTIPLPNGGNASVKSFAQKVTIGTIRYGTNGLEVTNYNLDQVTGIQAISAAINSGIASGAAAAASGGIAK